MRAAAILCCLCTVRRVQFAVGAVCSLIHTVKQSRIGHFLLCAAYTCNFKPYILVVYCIILG